ncbi:DUF3048 domain-containing protein [Aquisalibacillus elongatus]|uniref:DUF3048 family protein n=1 Tax=Aquisalibacillus elongatus TaxID=485577 RepID=A0A3N5BXS8_9BACI|nr:DUF3048 domain-containing protein [Aquisalibacillus elongatus]RPF50685.1 DUF3048 family protein [Aquisalibacillus elongatus]
MRKFLMVLLMLMLVALMACTDEGAEEPQDNEEDVEDPVDEPEESEDPVEEETEPEFTYPLTGLEADEESTNRALAVMVNNHTKARPQTGLTKADMVYEFLAEGPITRLLAIYHSDIADYVGPVRSAREYYIETAKAQNAIYIYHGAANFIEEDLRNGWVDNLNGAYYDDDGFLFNRESFRQAPHNSYVYLPNAYEVAGQNNLEREFEHDSWQFYNQDELENVDGDTAQQVDLTYNKTYSVSYTYDSDNQVYTRFSDGVKTKDLNTEEPMQVANILIFETSHEVIDDVGRRAIDRESGGNGYLIQQGTIKEVEWQNVDGLMKPFIDGEEAKLVPGQTWVNVIPNSPGLEQSVTYE